MPVCNESDPHGGRDHAADADYPDRREALGQDRRRPVEGAPAESQDAQYEREDARFLEIQSLQKRGEDAGDEQPESDVIGALDAPEQRA